MLTRRRLHFAHVISPVDLHKGHELSIAQKLTFQSIQHARRRAQKNANINVQCFAAKLRGESPAIPSFFKKFVLKRSVSHTSTFELKRNLPLLDDILRGLYQRSNADYFIYSNIDIAVQPHFYEAVASRINEGLDAFAINRKTLTWKKNTTAPDIEVLYQRKGRKHVGADCFVFKRSLLQNQHFGNLCLGVPHLGAVMISVLSTLTPRFQVLENERLTFHLGNSQTWKQKKFREHYRHNLNEGIAILLGLHSKVPALSPQALKSLQFFRGALKSELQRLK